MNKRERQENTLEASNRGVRSIRTRKAVAMEINHAWDLMGMRATAMHLLAKGNSKAFDIVRKMSSKLEELQVRIDSLTGIRMEQGGVAVTLKINQDQTVYWPGEKISPENWKEQAYPVIASMPDKESRIAEYYFQFCSGLIAWAQDAATEKQPLKRVELQLALNMINSILFNNLKGPGIRIGLTDVERPSITPCCDL